MSWSYLGLVPLLVCALACMPLGRVQRVALGWLTWLMRLTVLGGLSILGVLVLAPQWLPSEVVLSLDDWLRLPAADSGDPWRPAIGLLYAAFATLLAAPLLALLDFTRSLGRFESGCRTLTHLMRHTVRLAENARPQLEEGSSTTAPTNSSPKLKPSNNCLRPLSELLG
jgi:hypothetical protein